jgi:hypothetical protein
LLKDRVNCAAIVFCDENSRNLNEGCGEKVKINELFRQKQVKKTCEAVGNVVRQKEPII